MKLPFHLVIEYAHTKQWDVQKAFAEFFGQTSFPDKGQEEQVYPLFSEWLIFDYKQANGLTLLADFVLRNPENLDERLIATFQQVLASQWYGEFEIAAVERPNFLTLEHLYSGKKIKVFDQTSTPTIPSEGTLHARIAKADGTWFFVGSNPIFMPLTHTKRMKRLLRKEIDPYKVSPIDTWQLLAGKTPTPPKETITDIQKKREALKTQYITAMKRCGGSLSFERLAKIIYEENSKQPVDIFMSLTKKGLPEEVIFTEVELLQDIWNYFPHRMLHGKSPTEMFQKLSKAQKKKAK